jgi:fibronectin type 3 domain-containing protein
VHAHLLPTGKVMFFGYDDDARLWDPATGAFSTLARAGFNVFCSGHSFLPDGRLLLAGGSITKSMGLANAAIYDPVANAFSQLPVMNAGRWYPTNTTLANGDVLVVSGDIDPTHVNTLPQVWPGSGGGWRDLTTAQLALPLYPFMFVAPDGRVFQAGPNQNTRYLDTSGTGGWAAVANSIHGYRDYGSAVLYDQGKVLIVGGDDPPTNSAEVIDLSAATPAWRSVSPMVHRRRQLNTTLLPDGKVLVTGGSSGNGFDNASAPVYPAEMWDPATETWSTMASITRYRGYHSVALLLPDGRVLSAGGDSFMSAEVYSPPYLFNGPRPAIASAPAAINYGQSFLVTTPDAARVASVTLIRLSSVTHSINMDQRITKLPFSTALDVLTVAAPSSGNLAPPGYYMLFILDGAGIPSVARIVRIDAGPISIPAVPSGLAANAVSDTRINLTWTDSSTNEDGFKIERCMGAGCTGFAQVAQVNAGAVSYGNTGLIAATTYRYRVRSFNVSGDSAYSGVAEATTSSTPSLPAPAGLGATAGDGRVTLTWNAVSGATSYNVKSHTASGGPYLTRATGLQTPSYVDTGLTNGQTYFYVVSAQNAVAESANSSEVSARPLATTPAAPSNLVATAVSASRINLTWTDNASNESNYRIERCQGAGCSNFVQIAQVGANVTSRANTGLAAGTTYRYRVRARNSIGNSGYSNVATATTLTLPAAPTALTATPGPVSRAITLTWSDNSSDESGFKIERCTGASCTSFSQIAQVGANITTYRNTGRVTGTTYRYRVRAYSAAGNSAYSGIAVAQAP